jgi:hypothetical protein
MKQHTGPLSAKPVTAENTIAVKATMIANVMMNPNLRT